MNLFFELHHNLPREGPGDNASTVKAFSLIEKEGLPPNARLLDIGCGPGMQTLELAKQPALDHITAVDLHEPFLQALQTRTAEAGLQDRITVQKANMRDLPFAPESFDVIWSEGAIYIMGFANGLHQWKPLLKPNGYLVVSEVTWLQDDPAEEARAFWTDAYPAMQTIQANLAEIETAGYRNIAHFTLPESAWWEHYYTPLQAKITALRAQYADNPDALKQLDEAETEIEIYRRHADSYGYVFYVMQNRLV